MQWLIPVTNLVATVSNDFVPRLPRMHLVVRMRRIVLAIVGSESCEWTGTVKYKRFYWQIRITRCGRDGGEQSSLKKQSVSLKGVCVWDVNSTVTKHSDYLIEKDSAWLDAVTTPVDKTRVNSCVLKHLFVWGKSATKKSPKIPEMLSPTRYSCHINFPNLTAGAPKNNNMQSAFFSLIRGQRFWDFFCFNCAQHAQYTP